MSNTILGTILLIIVGTSLITLYATTPKAQDPLSCKPAEETLHYIRMCRATSSCMLSTQDMQEFEIARTILRECTLETKE